MAYDYDVLTIGLGPGGMAVSGMAKGMGLKVAAIEKHRIGGECMNVGCIPSKAILRVGKTRHVVHKHEPMAIEPREPANVGNPFDKIRERLAYINGQKNTRMLTGVDMIWESGRFIDRHTVQAGDRKVTAHKIFVSAGTVPARPPIEGIDKVEILTNRNIFELNAIPKSMTVLGGGAIGCEMAQAFTRLGTKVTVLTLADRLMENADEEMVGLVEKIFQKEGIDVRTRAKTTSIRQDDQGIHLACADGSVVTSEKFLLAVGRRPDYGDLGLENAGIELTPKGWIKVDKYLRTTAPNIYGVGDCNGHFLFSHSAMHQGMVALMNSISFWPFLQDFRKFVVPYTMFTEPQISWVGETRAQLEARGVTVTEVRSNYGDYGAAIAEHVETGFVKVLTDRNGRIYGAGVVGEGSSDLINEWGLAIQKKMRITDVMFLQHSFPSMSFLNKRASEIWMMKRMETAPRVKSIIGRLIRV